MDINFIADPNQMPKPRGEIRVEEIHAEPLEGGHRIRIELRITPFAPNDRPNITVQVIYPDGANAGETSVIESMHNQVTMIFHLRDEAPPTGLYHIRAGLYFDDDVMQGTAEIGLDLPGNPA